MDTSTAGDVEVYAFQLVKDKCRLRGGEKVMKAGRGSLGGAIGRSRKQQLAAGRTLLPFIPTDNLGSGVVFVQGAKRLCIVQSTAAGTIY